MTDRVGVIGGTGFIGRAVARALRDSGREPVLLAPEAPAGMPDDLADVSMRYVDIADHEATVEAIANVALETVVHLAAYGAGAAGLLQGAAEHPRRAVAVNIGGFLSVIEAAASVGCRRIVWSSSTTVYGPAERYSNEPVTEDVPLWPVSVYGTTKAACEFLAGQVGPPRGVEVTALRLPLVYGPGRWYGGSQADLMAFVRDVAAGRPARLVATDDVWDWLHVCDAAAAFVAALDAVTSAPAYNVVGHRASFAQMGQAAAALATADAHVEIVPSSSPRLPLIDGSRAEQELGFKPAFDLQAGMADYVRREQEALA